MRHKFWHVVLFLTFCASSFAAPQSPGSPPLQPPQEMGAGPGASDSVTAVPEGGSVVNNAYTNQYFGLSYPIPTGWSEGYKGPPPSEKGYYVLQSLRYPDKGTMVLLARDLFFTGAPANNAMELIKFTAEKLAADYKVGRRPTEVQIGGHSFARLDYVSPAAQLHWYTMATGIRCHSVDFVITGRDGQYLESLVEDMKRMKLPAGASATSGTGGGDSPVCIKDYATDENLVHKVDPVLPGRRFNAIPVRIIIDENGSVKHVHVIRAFPEQRKVVTDALLQWKFKPYLRNGQQVAVETGIMLGYQPAQNNPPATKD